MCACFQPDSRVRSSLIFPWECRHYKCSRHITNAPETPQALTRILGIWTQAHTLVQQTLTNWTTLHPQPTMLPFHIQAGYFVANNNGQRWLISLSSTTYGFLLCINIPYSPVRQILIYRSKQVKQWSNSVTQLGTGRVNPTPQLLMG